MIEGQKAAQPPSTVLGTVVGRVASDVLCVLVDSGWSVTLRVPVEVASEDSVGRRARLIVGSDGFPSSLRLIGSAPRWGLESMSAISFSR